jgi:hypothetical protein
MIDRNHDRTAVDSFEIFHQYPRVTIDCGHNKVQVHVQIISKTIFVSFCWRRAQCVAGSLCPTQSPVDIHSHALPGRQISKHQYSQDHFLMCSGAKYKEGTQFMKSNIFNSRWNSMELRWYSDQAMGCMTEDLGARFLAGNFPPSSAFRPALESIYCNGYRGPFHRGLRDWGVKLTTHFLKLRLKMREATLSFRPTPSRRGT